MTNEMMFYSKAQSPEEQRIRREGLDKLTTKLHQKLKRYKKPYLVAERQNAHITY